MKTDYELILLAAGQGNRMHAVRNKVLLPLLDKPMIVHTLRPFFADPYCKHIIITVNADEQLIIKELIVKEFSANDTPVSIVIGGSERQYSSYNGLQYLKQPKDGYVMIHDAARPFIKQREIDRLNEQMQRTGGAILAVPPKDTIKLSTNGKVKQTIPRQTVWHAQTPQAFSSSLAIAAHERALQQDFFGTDDAAVVEQIFEDILIVEGSYDNLKMTTAEDLIIGEMLLSSWRESEEQNR